LVTGSFFFCYALSRYFNKIDSRTFEKPSRKGKGNSGKKKEEGGMKQRNEEIMVLQTRYRHSLKKRLEGEGKGKKNPSTAFVLSPFSLP